MIIHLESHILASPERVFAAATDFANMADFVEAIIKMEILTEGPIGEGTRFKETRKMMGKEATEEMTIHSFDPPRGFQLHANSCGTFYETTFSFEPEGKGTRLKMSFKGTPQTFMARVLGTVFFFMKGMLRKMVQKDLDQLKTRVEMDSPTAS